MFAIFANAKDELTHIKEQVDSCEVDDQFARCDYGIFEVVVNCQNNGAIYSAFYIGRDTGNENTSNSSYFLDPEPAMANCQQSSNQTYASIKKGFDVGHLTPKDIFDDNWMSARKTNVVTNLLPQETSLNRTGLWRQTEKIVDCYRDSEKYNQLFVISGPIYGSDKSNDHYSISHGLAQTPDYFWKVVYSDNHYEYDAWLVFNQKNSNSKYLSDHRRSVSSILSLLRNESAVLYSPAIEKLKVIEKNAVRQVELINLPECHRRRG